MVTLEEKALSGVMFAIITTFISNNNICLLRAPVCQELYLHYLKC